MANANPLRGESDLGDRTIRIDFNSWCIAEAALGMKVPAIENMLSAGQFGFEDIRRLVRSFLVGGENMSLEEVGDLIEEVGLEAVGFALSSARERATPPASEGKAERPRKAA